VGVVHPHRRGGNATIEELKPLITRHTPTYMGGNCGLLLMPTDR